MKKIYALTVIFHDYSPAYYVVAERLFASTEEAEAVVSQLKKITARIRFYSNILFNIERKQSKRTFMDVSKIERRELRALRDQFDLIQSLFPNSTERISSFTEKAMPTVLNCSVGLRVETLTLPDSF